ncbi:glycosyltransferase family 2 protein [Atribacter laminatus]|uniref:UDP-Glc:alpha-D-GlcNAc-diphosphoundecaprenol beta-1,3-glucosyltransferase WfgD n=1 Tax=Atribacter laminatus TaxID=2847778 RepID=A0A7T1F1T4_ATRLM|nr:glycosyltransferase [Atribacter laminatus]QPM67313.1 UDP-Glc:alpha-D-GlcNAc-diphosphoundecaprenol beta-1,3-glucosyltransferase WfgD [Atribacter laminatus]
MNVKPTVSVIIPTYNRAHLIDRAIQSVLNQTYQDFELIIVDDGSSDNTEEVVKKIQDNRIYYYKHDKNKGGSAARNTGISLAKGEYIAFLDSDDLWYQDYLSRQVSTIELSLPDVGMVCCGIKQINQDFYKELKPSIIGFQFSDHLKRASGICTSAFVVRRSAFDEIGGFDNELKSFQDFEFLLRISSKYKVNYIDDILIEYRLQDDSISINMELKAQGLQCIVNRYMNDICRLGLTHKYMFKLGQYYVMSGQRMTGFLCWRKALSYKPFYGKIWKHFLISLGGVSFYRQIILLNRKRFFLQRRKHQKAIKK